MNDELLELFIKEDCDQHAQSVLLSAIKEKTGTDGIEDFTFNRFNIRLDFGTNQVVIDDDLNPSDGECRLPLAVFSARVAEINM
jgi:hypothetical protein|uniref:hypothetical protein n=1 Tax=Prosthecobacter sp. TaxID=1965333 RepID=UPI00378377CB